MESGDKKEGGIFRRLFNAVLPSKKAPILLSREGRGREILRTLRSSGGLTFEDGVMSAYEMVTSMRGEDFHASELEIRAEAVWWASSAFAKLPTDPDGPSFESYRLNLLKIGSAHLERELPRCETADNIRLVVDGRPLSVQTISLQTVLDSMLVSPRDMNIEVYFSIFCSLNGEGSEALAIKSLEEISGIKDADIFLGAYNAFHGDITLDKFPILFKDAGWPINRTIEAGAIFCFYEDTEVLRFFDLPPIDIVKIVVGAVVREGQISAQDLDDFINDLLEIRDAQAIEKFLARLRDPEIE